MASALKLTIILVAAFFCGCAITTHAGILDDCEADLTLVTTTFNGYFAKREELGYEEGYTLQCEYQDDNRTHVCAFAPPGVNPFSWKSDNGCCCPTLSRWVIPKVWNNKRVMQLGGWNLYQAYYIGICPRDQPKCDCNVEGKCQQVYKVESLVTYRPKGGWHVQYFRAPSHCRCRCDKVVLSNEKSIPAKQPQMN